MKTLEKIKSKALLSAIFMILLTSLSGCEVIGGIFKAGMGVGIFIVVAVVVLVIYLIARFSKGK